MIGECEVAGLRCSGVLERLSEFLDGELGKSERDAIVAHLAGCDTCARFGGKMTEAVAMLLATLAEEAVPTDLESEAIFARLRSRLDDLRGTSG
jgi:anti-sigma factor (TIGR02949 family)